MALYGFQQEALDWMLRCEEAESDGEEGAPATADGTATTTGRADVDDAVAAAGESAATAARMDVDDAASTAGESASAAAAGKSAMAAAAGAPPAAPRREHPGFLEVGSSNDVSFKDWAS